MCSVCIVLIRRERGDRSDNYVWLILNCCGGLYAVECNVCKCAEYVKWDSDREVAGFENCTGLMG